MNSILIVNNQIIKHNLYHIPKKLKMKKILPKLFNNMKFINKTVLSLIKLVLKNH